MLPPRPSHPRVPAEDPGAAGPELTRQQRPIRGEATPVFFIGASLCLARFSVYSASFKNIYILKSQTCAHSTKIIDAERLKTAREAAERGSAGREGRAPPLRQATPPASVAWEIRRQPEACARPPAQRGPLRKRGIHRPRWAIPRHVTAPSSPGQGQSRASAPSAAPPVPDAGLGPEG